MNGPETWKRTELPGEEQSPGGVVDGGVPVDDGELAAMEAEIGPALRAALARSAAPAGFAERVLAAAGADAAGDAAPRAKVLPFRTVARAWRLTAAGAIAATVLAGAFVAQEARAHHEAERRAQAATSQFETAERITDQALQHTREQLERSGALRDLGD